MAFRATQVWIQVPALPLTGCVMLVKSCSSQSLSFLICMRESTYQSVWSTVSHAGGVSPRHLATLSPRPLLAHSSLRPLHTVLCPKALPCLACWTKVLSFCTVGTSSGKPSQTPPEGWSILVPQAPAVLWSDGVVGVRVRA